MGTIKCGLYCMSMQRQDNYGYNKVWSVLYVYVTTRQLWLQ